MDEIKLTKGEAESLLDFLECHLIDCIRSDEECDNLVYVENLVRIWRKCGGKRVDDEAEAALGGDGDG